ncbi:MAG: division/cell wall cluster transcriptional repressor MraZ [Ketobacteraceae bacterium]|nr:division/cell wall cluster transcriptional repressor MraZ [Ketobacteraceae bacterium]
MFRGVNAINLDAKGRMAMPTRYRDSLQERCEGQMVATIDTEEKCLLLYPIEDWLEIERKIEALPSFNKAARRVQRLLIGHATDVEMDSNGRLVIPPVLRSYAELDKKIMLVGQGKKFEIWSEDLWNEKRDAWLEEDNLGDEALPEDMMTLSL